MTLDVRSATIIVECARRGSLGAAATALNMTQPAVTRMLKRLEESYGVTLFERTTRGVVTTAFGEALLPYAKLMVSEAGNADDVMKQMRGAGRGLVRIGGVGSVVGGFLLAAIGEMRRQHPDVRYQIVEDLEDRLLEALKSGDIDIVISPEPYIDDDIVLATTETLHDLVGVFVRSDNPILGRTHVPLEEAATLDWAMPPQSAPTAREWLRRFHDRSLEPNTPLIASRSVQVIKAAVLQEGLFGWMPTPLMRHEFERGEVGRVAIPELEWRRSVRVYRRKKGLLAPSAATLIQCIRFTSEKWGGSLT